MNQRLDQQYERKKIDNLEEKLAVALTVYHKFIQHDGNPRIFIDAGSSAALVADVMRLMVEHERTRKRAGDHIPQRRVFTHNLAAWEALKDVSDIDLYLAGGRYNAQLNSILEGELFDKFLELNCNISVIAVSGIDQNGLYCSNVQDEAIIKKALAGAKVECRIIIADHTKIGKTDVKQFCETQQASVNCDKLYLVSTKPTPGKGKKAMKAPSAEDKQHYLTTIEAFRKLGEVILVDLDGVRAEHSKFVEQYIREENESRSKDRESRIKDRADIDPVVLTG